MGSIDIGWNNTGYLVSSSDPLYSGAVPLRSLTEQELRPYLQKQGVNQEAINKVVELVPQKVTHPNYPSKCYSFR